MKYYMGVDFGTQSVRCGVYDTYGRLQATGECAYETYFPEAGWSEQDPEEWKSALKKAVLMCRDNAGDSFSKVEGIAIDTTASTVVMSSNDGKALDRAILWMDNRAKEQADRINTTGSDVLRYCGGAVSVEWLLPKMLWLKENRSELYNAADIVCEMQDYMNYYLTGEWCASVSQATCKACYVDERGGFDRAFLKVIGLEEYETKGNARVLLQGEKIGKLRRALAAELGLSEDVTVYQGGIDAHISMIGLGVLHSGDMGLVMGSSYVHLAAVDKPSFSNEIWGPYKNAIVPGLYCLEGGQVSAASITKWFLKEFSITGENPYGIMQEEASKVAPCSNGLIALDFFQGNRTPYKDPRAKGVFYGLTLSHTRADIYRAILEGVAFGTRNIIDGMERGGVKIEAIMGCGGVTKNEEWLHIISDTTSKPIILTEQSANAGILGCAMIAAVGSGAFADFISACEKMVHVTKRIEPNANNREAYDQAFKKYLELYKQLKPIMDA